MESKFGFAKNLLIALLLAGLIRSFCFEPFHIPSSSMKPKLLIGDYIFVSKYSYGYSRYSFPFGFNLFKGRIFAKKPQRGDVAVFRLPSNPKINYVKRIIGLPGDRVQMISGKLVINDEVVKKSFDGFFVDDDFPKSTREPGIIVKFFNKLFTVSQVPNIEDQKFKSSNGKIKKFIETLPEGKMINVFDQSITLQDNTGIYEVPEGSYFVMGDNRDNSQDSRFLDYVGYIPEENLIGRADLIFFSIRKSIWRFWEWEDSIRFNRIFQKIY